MCLRGTIAIYVAVRRQVLYTKRHVCEVRSKLDQLSCKLKRCRYTMQMREIEVSKRELGRYAPKKTKTGRSPANAGDLAALVIYTVCKGMLL